MSSDSRNVGKNILYASLSTFIPALFTFLFWFVTAKYVGPDAIGYASTFASISMVLSGFVLYDTNLGMKRYLGIAYAHGDLQQFKNILISTLLFSLVTMSIISIFLVLNGQILNFMGVKQEFIWPILLLLPILSLQLLFSEALISSLKSKNLLIPQIIGSLIRFPILFIFIFYIDSAIIGTIIAYSSFFFVCALLYSLDLYRFLKSYSVQLNDFVSNIKEIISTGLSSWLPHIISIIGSQLSIITIFAVQGAIEAGIFYLPMAIFTITLFIVTGITRVGHPLIAGMESRSLQSDFVLRSMKIALVITIPISTPLLIFPAEFLGILGQEYSTSGGTLSLFMLGLPLSIVSEIFYYYEYGMGRKTLLLKLGLASNVPRVMLYFLLIPGFGQMGAALAFTAGSLIQVIYSWSLAKRDNIRLLNKRYIYITILPYMVAILIWLTNMHFVISSFLIILISFILYIRFHFITDQGVRFMLNILLPTNLAKKAIPLTSKIVKLLS
ncbi:MAG: polysaccharide biosynthesis C-terminal domain-containing protein [Candidatus Nitrosocosmicus sp.]|nr:polysaccharide biosynthesis C-terminal domain-containing protein [Candidatus Nitrosocosmicus sp.]